MTTTDPPVRPAPPAVPPVEVLVHRADRGLALPAYAQPSDAGADLVTAQDVVLGPGERTVVGTGLSIALPAGYAAFVHPRSGLAARHGLSVVNAPGTVDAGYRGEIKVILINTDRSATISLRRGDRIAQLVVQRVEHAMFREVDELPASVRGAGGFGSTGGFGPDRPAPGATNIIDSAAAGGTIATAGTDRERRSPAPATVAGGKETAGVRPRT